MKNKILNTAILLMAGGCVGKIIYDINKQCDSPEATSRLLTNRMDRAIEDGDETECGELARELLSDIMINVKYGILFNKKDLKVITNFFNDAFDTDNTWYEISKNAQTSIPYLFNMKFKIIFHCKGDELTFTYDIDWRKTRLVDRVIFMKIS